jgi:hypothetical protein
MICDSTAAMTAVGAKRKTAVGPEQLLTESMMS